MMPKERDGIAYDLHCHTKYSRDSLMEPSAMVKRACKLGLGGIAVTDHDTITGARKVKELAPGDLEIIIGCEVSTDRGEVIGLFLSDEIVSHDLETAVQEIRDMGGLVIVPHPFDRRRGSALHPRDEDVHLLDGVEIWNSRCIDPSYNDHASTYAKLHDLPYTAGSDAHFINELGSSALLLKNGDLRKSILSKDCEVRRGSSHLWNHAMSVGLKKCRKGKYG